MSEIIPDPPVRPFTPMSNAYDCMGYEAGWAQHHIFGPLTAWGFTPEHAKRRWKRKAHRRLRKQARVEEKCPTCGGTDREGGTVATMGPDEFGNYETDDCPDDFHR